MSRSPPTRRDVLKTTGGLLAGLGAVESASAQPPEKVRVNVGLNGRGAQRAAEQAADSVHHRFGFGAMTLEVPEPALRGLQNRPDVRYVERDAEMEAVAQSEPWGVDRVDAEVAHADGATGDGVDVAILDSGIDPSHPDLEPNLGEGQAFFGGFGHSFWRDANGHGTHVAGTVAAVDDDSGVVGVSPDATLHAVKVLTALGTGFTSDIAAGIEYTADQGWDVANMSLTGSDSQLLREAVQYAHESDVLLVAAAGNDGPCEDCVGYPAAYPEVLAVSATTPNDELAEFSSTGPEVDVAAPGEGVTSTYLGGDYQAQSGTSMASPHVAGAAAQLLAAGYAPDAARERLLQTAEDVGLAPEEQGAGLLDVAAALDYESADDLDGSVSVEDTTTASDGVTAGGTDDGAQPTPASDDSSPPGRGLGRGRGRGPK